MLKFPSTFVHSMYSSTFVAFPSTVRLYTSANQIILRPIYLFVFRPFNFDGTNQQKDGEKVQFLLKLDRPPFFLFLFLCFLLLSMLSHLESREQSYVLDYGKWNSYLIVGRNWYFSQRRKRPFPMCHKGTSEIIDHFLLCIVIS